MKVLRIASGLGNQMFEYALYLQLKKMYPDEKLYVDTMYYEIFNYPREIEAIFNLDFSESDIYKRCQNKFGKEFNQAVDELKVWKKFGLSEMQDFSKNEAAWSYIPYLHLKEIPELYDKFGYEWNEMKVQGSISLKEFERNFRKDPKYRYVGTTKRRAILKNIIRNRRLQQWIGIFANSDQRRTFFKQILTLKKPNGCGYESLERVKTDQRNVYLGLYGNPDDCVGIEEELRRTFQFMPFDNKRNKKLSDWMQKYNSVSVHVRLKHKQYGYDSIGGAAYYRKAVKYIKKKVNHPVFFVFSDEIEYCKKNLDSIGLCDRDKVIYVEGNTGAESYRDMQLMSLCKHNIVPNSTFSWWGAFLNENPSKIIVTPFRTLPGTISF